jgi:hypothetical protein
MQYLYLIFDKLDWIGYKQKHLARKQYLQLLYLFQIMHATNFTFQNTE